jgi:hypothetical protein
MQTIIKPTLPPRAPDRQTRSPSAEPRDAHRFRHLLDEAEAEAEAADAAAQGSHFPPPPPPSPLLPPPPPPITRLSPAVPTAPPPAPAVPPDGGPGMPAPAHGVAASATASSATMTPSATTVLDAAALELRVSPSPGKLAALNGLVIQATWKGAGLGLSLRPPAGALSERLKRAAPALADALSAALGVDVALEVHDER